MKRAVMRAIYRLNSRSRVMKLDFFWDVFKPRPGTCVLNLGAAPPHRGRVLLGYNRTDLLEQPEQDPRWKTLRVIGCSLNREDMREYRRLYQHLGFAALVVDGCQLPFPDKSIDIVFSNAVIEHVHPPDQLRMAKEIMRVGRSWFVTTPNFWYPVELHNMLPFLHFLPKSTQFAIEERLGTYPPTEPLNLLSARQLRGLFPGSSIRRVRVTFYPETLIAYRADGIGAAS